MARSDPKKCLTEGSLFCLIAPSRSGKVSHKDLTIWGGPKKERLVCEDVRIYSSTRALQLDILRMEAGLRISKLIEGGFRLALTKLVQLIDDAGQGHQVPVDWREAVLESTLRDKGQVDG
jgi:hypothetical protein